MMTEDDVWVCAYCGYKPATEVERARHEEGIDDKRLACAHQDIGEINARQTSRRRHVSFMGGAWG